MADTLTRHLNEQDRYYNSAIYAAFEYQKRRKDGEHPDTSEADRILDDYLRSVLAGYRAKIAQYELDARSADFVQKESLKTKIDLTRKRMKEIESVINTDIVTNPCAKGVLYEGYCPLFEDELMASFTLFNEIKRYYETTPTADDRDRSDILNYISEVEGLVKEQSSAVVSHEREVLESRVTELKKAFENNPLVPLNYVLNDLANEVLHNDKENLDYRLFIYDNHEPQYTTSSPNAYDGFKNEMTILSSGIIRTKVERFKYVYDFLDFKINEICNVLLRQAEVKEISSLVSKLKEVLESKNGFVIDRGSKISLDYSLAIRKCEEFIKFLQGLSKKYADRLGLLKYDELKKAFKEAKIAEKNQVEKKEPIDKFHAAQKKEEAPVMEEPVVQGTVITETLEEVNNRKITENKLSRDFLILSAEDLFMFGNLISANIDQLTPEDMAKVINHCDKLKSLAGLSEDDKARIRASWPRIVDGRLIVSTEPNESEIAMQKVRDNLRSMYYRIDTYAPSDEMKM